MTPPDNIVTFPQMQGSLLCRIELVRRPDGSIGTNLCDMAGALIDKTGDDVPSRVAIIADWLREGSDDMKAQAGQWAEWLGERHD